MARSVTSKSNKSVLSLPARATKGGRPTCSQKTLSANVNDIHADCFRVMADKSPIGIVVHHFHQPLYVNESWSRLFGYTTSEVMDKSTFIELAHEVDRERLRQYRDDRLKSLKVPDHYLFRGIHKDGRTLWLEHFVGIIDWQGQQAIMALTVDVDEQERRAVELRRQQLMMERWVQERSKALTQSNRDLHVHQSILDQMSDRISVVDKEYCFHMSNRASLNFKNCLGSKSSASIFGKLWGKKNSGPLQNRCLIKLSMDIQNDLSVLKAATMVDANMFKWSPSLLGILTATLVVPSFPYATLPRQKRLKKSFASLLQCSSKSAIVLRLLTWPIDFKWPTMPISIFISAPRIKSWVATSPMLLDGVTLRPFQNPFSIDVFRARSSRRDVLKSMAKENKERSTFFLNLNATLAARLLVPSSSCAMSPKLRKCPIGWPIRRASIS